MALERFNRYPFVCAAVLHHDEDICRFLQKFDHVTNNLACIVCCFEPVEFLRVFALVEAAVGLHLIEPFVRLTSSCKTTYSDLQSAFPRLYNDFLNVNPKEFLQFQKPA